MEVRYNVTGNRRKELVKVISETVGVRPIYQFMPTCNYEIDIFTVTKDGTLLFSDRSDTEIVEKVLEAIGEAGFECEPADGVETTDELDSGNEEPEATTQDTVAEQPETETQDSASEEVETVGQDTADEQPEAAGQDTAGEVPEAATQDTTGEEQDTAEQDTTNDQLQTPDQDTTAEQPEPTVPNATAEQPETVTQDTTAEQPDAAAQEAMDTTCEENSGNGSDQEGFTISLPADGFTADALDRLKRLVESKSKLIKKALGVATLDINTDAEKVTFPWWDTLPTPEEIRAYTAFISALFRMAKEAKRVTATERDVESEKYVFRGFLVRLGFAGADSKDVRKLLLKNLSGSSAFPNREKAEAFNVAQKVKRDAAKAAARTETETSSEADSMEETA